MDELIGKKVLVKEERLGTFFGTLIDRDKSGVRLKDCTKIVSARSKKFMRTEELKDMYNLGGVMVIQCSNADAEYLENLPVKRKLFPSFS